MRTNAKKKKSPISDDLGLRSPVIIQKPFRTNPARTSIVARVFIAIFYFYIVTFALQLNPREVLFTLSDLLDEQAMVTGRCLPLSLPVHLPGR